MRNTVIESHNGQLMSKTQHYRKVTKPLLERKRRARMNHYLDELKNLIVETMEAQGEHITKLEKADILEMTVTYLKSKNQLNSINNISNDQNSTKSSTSSTPLNPEKFRAGYTQAAYEVSKVFASVPGLDVDFGTKLMKHLGYKLKDLQPPPSPQQQSSSTGAISSLHHQSRSSSPTTLNDQSNQFEFIEKSNNLLEKQQRQIFDDTKHNNDRMMLVVTPPQSPNLIHCRPSVLTLNFNKDNMIEKTQSGNIIVIEKHHLVEHQHQNQQNSGGDVWRPW